MSVLFLVQVEPGTNIPRMDFCFEAINAIEFIAWMNDSDEYRYLRVSSVAEAVTIGKTEISKSCSLETKTVIPIGSIEFTHAYYKNVYSLTGIKPLNIPKELRWATGRKIFDVSEKTINGEGFIKNNFSNKKAFIKSGTGLKKFTEIIGENVLVPADKYLVSEVVEMDSEWRCFVLDGQLLDCRCYSGDFKLAPNYETVDKMIAGYKSSPRAYTLDVAVVKGETVIVEVHDFYSCGLYGFSNYNKLIKMTMHTHNALRKRGESLLK